MLKLRGILLISCAVAAVTVFLVVNIQNSDTYSQRDYRFPLRDKSTRKGGLFSPSLKYIRREPNFDNMNSINNNNNNDNNANNDSNSNLMNVNNDIVNNVRAIIKESYAPVIPAQTPSSPVWKRPNRCGFEIHAFYYAWYETPEFDGAWKHWRHEVLDGSKRMIEPPDDIASHFWPALGLYSSNDPKLIEEHMRMMSSNGIGVIVHSWYPENACDDQGGCADKITVPLLDAAAKFGMMVNFHIEPYRGRNPATVRQDIEYVINKYGKHPGFYRDMDGKPWFYVYDSYLSPAHEWEQLLSPLGGMSIRNSPIDSVMIGLLVNEMEKNDLIRSQFDAHYNYFAADGFTLGSTHRNFGDLAAFARANNRFFIPCIGPGYIDEKVRPYNTRNTHMREDGGYFQRAWDAAKNSLVRTANPNDLGKTSNKGAVIAITSWNEWHEGTQIEPAISKQGFMDYGGMGSDGYLAMLSSFVKDSWQCAN